MGGSGLMGTEKCSLCENSKKKCFGGGGSGRRGVGGLGGGQGGCEWRTEALVKIQKKKIFVGGGVGSGGSGWGIRVDGNGD